MVKLRKQGFTLIELIAVLVIMAILALIVTPLVMNIIRKARIAADKRSIDAYGRSIELAIASYLLDTGKFPTDVSELTIEYSGDTVSCETTQINPDSSVYLAGCIVKNRTVEGYAYGNDKQPKIYSVGDVVTYNGVDYYVIKDSGTNDLTVTLLKADPLSYTDVQTYSTGTGASISNQDGYGGIQYHLSSSAYDSSYVKTTVEAWKIAKAPAATEARLITLDDLKNNLGYEQVMINPSTQGYATTSSTPSWVYNSNYCYWTMSPKEDSHTVWKVLNSKYLDDSGGDLPSNGRVVRPVIVLPKSALN